MRVMRVSALALGVAVLAAGPAFAQLSKDDQGCINEVNKGLGKLVKTVNKEAQGCIKDQSNEKNPSAQACIDADAKGKVAKAEGKNVDGAIKKCTAASAGTIDAYFGTDIASPTDIGNQTNAEGADKESRILTLLLGSDLDAGVIQAKVGGATADKDGAKCQQGLLKDLFKCQDTKLKEFSKCKKDYLKNDLVGDPAGLAAACMDGPGLPDPKGKIAKACSADPNVGKPGGTMAKKCQPKGVAVADALPGACAQLGADADVLGCAERAVECNVCSTINAVDGTNADCDEFDDGVINESCSPCSNASDGAAITSIIACVSGCPTGDIVCAGTCIAAGGLSGSCGVCFTSLFTCGAANCLNVCTTDAGSVACQSCLQSNGCSTCLGLPPPAVP